VILLSTKKDRFSPHQERAPEPYWPGVIAWGVGFGERADMRNSDPYVVAAGVFIVLAVIGLTGFLVAQLSVTSPAIVAAVLTAFAAVLAAIPPIIKALRGR
jgi:hypothetical protein